jgi:hypothetical protein
LKLNKGFRDRIGEELSARSEHEVAPDFAQQTEIDELAAFG